MAWIYLTFQQQNCQIRENADARIESKSVKFRMQQYTGIALIFAQSVFHHLIPDNEQVKMLLARVVILPLAYFPLGIVAFTSLHRISLFKPSNTVVGSSASAQTTLSQDTTWDLRFLLQSVPTENGKKVDELFSAKVQFIEDIGYEPPQGTLKQILGLGEEPSFKILSSRWQLSEDPNDRKDGLWVWGLFAEPLYPFMLLQLETDRIPLPGDDTDAIKPLKLFAQLNHQREKGVGVILSGGKLNIKEAETFKADPFGAASVTIYDDVTVGNLQVQVSTKS